MTMKIIFIGGVNFSYEILKSILENKWDISMVFSYHESKQNFFSDMTSLDDLTQKYDIPHIKVKHSINDNEHLKVIQDLNPDLILVMGWSQLLSEKIIRIPKYGVIGSHPTKLPKYRGRAPIPWTILKKLSNSALTFFYIEEGIDNGDILDQKEFLIDQNDDAESLYLKITHLGKQMIIENLPKIEQGTGNKIKQEPSLFIENWPKRTPDDGRIDWSQNSENVQTLIRASTHPYPGAFSFYNKSRIIIWKSELNSLSSSNYGEIIKIMPDGIVVSCKQGSILIKKISYQDYCNINPTKVFSENNLGEFLK